MTADPPTTFADVLRKGRQQRGRTEEELAEAAGFSVRGISGLEHSVSTPGPAATLVTGSAEDAARFWSLFDPPLGTLPPLVLR